MLVWKYIRMSTVLSYSLLLVSAPLASANPPTSSTATPPAGAPTDGQHDFDFEVGSWKDSSEEADASADWLHCLG